MRNARHVLMLTVACWLVACSPPPTEELLSITFGSGANAPPVEVDTLCSNGGCDALAEVEAFRVTEIRLKGARFLAEVEAEEIAKRQIGSLSGGQLQRAIAAHRRYTLTFNEPEARLVAAARFGALLQAARAAR